MVPSDLKNNHPCHPTAKEYPALLQFLSRCYGFSDPKWFENDTAFFFGTRSSQLKTKWALKAEGKFVSHVGIFPFEALIEGRPLKVAGIGSVATDPDFRGRGFIKRLMDHVGNEMKKDGFDLSILWGERSLYGPFGYERGVFEDHFTFNKRSLRFSVLPKGVRPLKPSDWPFLEKLYSHHPFRIKRVSAYTKTLHRRFAQSLPEPIWVLEESGKLKAYAILLKTGGDGLEVAEWGGGAEDVTCLLATLLAKTGANRVSLPLYPGSGFYDWALENHDSQARVNSSCMVKVLDLGRVLKAFEPQLQSRYQALGVNLSREVVFRTEDGQSAGLVMGKKLSVMSRMAKGTSVELSSAECVRLLFGVGRPSEALKTKLPGKEYLDLLFPLQWFWWRSDWV
jgi:predicted acetyltransferase